ncbi:hypothetical protein JCM10213_003944 [Rhodosporidiobolus nylandii]
MTLAHASPSPFGRLPDELVAHILEDVFLASILNRDTFATSTSLSSVCADRRWYRIARPIWLHTLYRRANLQEDLMVGLLLRPSVHPHVRSVHLYVLSWHLRYDLAAISQFPNLTSLSLVLWDEDEHDNFVFPAALSQGLQQLPHLRSLDISCGQGGEPFVLEDAEFNLGRHLPSLRRFTTETCMCAGIWQLLSSPTNLEALQLSLAAEWRYSRVWEHVPFSTLRSLDLSSDANGLPYIEDLLSVLHKHIHPVSDYITQPLPLRALTFGYGAFEIPQPAGEATDNASASMLDMPRLSSLLELLSSGGLRSLTLKFDDRVDWSMVSGSFDSIRELKLEGGTLHKYEQFRRLCHFVSLFPSLDFLRLEDPRFSESELDQSRQLKRPVPPFDTPQFVARYPHLISLLAFVRRSNVRYLGWTTYDSPSFMWARAEREEDFVMQSWSGSR